MRNFQNCVNLLRSCDLGIESILRIHQFFFNTNSLTDSASFDTKTNMLILNATIDYIYLLKYLKNFFVRNRCCFSYATFQSFYNIPSLYSYLSMFFIFIQYLYILIVYITTLFFISVFT